MEKITKNLQLVLMVIILISTVIAVGIEINKNDPHKHVTFRNIRNFNREIYDEFWNMLKGNF